MLVPGWAESSRFVFRSFDLMDCPKPIVLLSLLYRWDDMSRRVKCVFEVPSDSVS